MNRGFKYQERVGPGGEGRDLLSYLSARHLHSSTAEWLSRVEGGLVLVDGFQARPEAILRHGQIVTWNRPPWDEPDVPLHYALLHEDADCIAVAKPSGLPTLPGGGFLEHTLLHLVRRRSPFASPAHRLGRGTSGIVLFTLTPESGRVVALAWREHRVEKVYRALVEGPVREQPFAVETPIGPTPHPLLGLVYAASLSGKPSHSTVRLLENREGATSLVEVTIRTGRPHQIRIHMAACGHPLVGDPLYAPGGGFLDSGARLPGDTGYHLHALRLTLPHPATAIPLCIECAAPQLLRSGAETLSPTERCGILKA